MTDSDQTRLDGLRYARMLRAIAAENHLDLLDTSLMRKIADWIENVVCKEPK